ncbi:MAG: hypothetical protein ACTSXD_05595 [Candidatus Heimdallarchaeaceae archaeon]
MNGNPEIIIKLFDTLRDATDKNERTMQTLINQQQTLVDTVKHMPIDEIRQEVKDHVVSAKAERIVISDKVDKVDSKVGKMILVVIVAFTLISSAILIGRMSRPIDTTTHSNIEETIEELKKEIDEFHNKK